MEKECKHRQGVWYLNLKAVMPSDDGVAVRCTNCYKEFVTKKKSRVAWAKKMGARERKLLRLMKND